MTRVHAVTRHAVARLERIREELMATETGEAGEGTPAAQASRERRRRLEAKSGEMDRAVLQLWRHLPQNDADGTTRELEAVEGLCHMVDGILEAEGAVDWEGQLRSKK